MWYVEVVRRNHVVTVCSVQQVSDGWSVDIQASIHEDNFSLDPDGMRVYGRRGVVRVPFQVRAPCVSEPESARRDARVS